MPYYPSNPIVQLRITLLGIEPRIWRRFRVSSDITLDTLHEVIQAVMGWENCHMHEFHIGDRCYGVPWEDESLREAPGFYEIEDQKQVRLSQVVDGKGDQCVYLYDPGDCWEHRLKVEKVFQRGKGREYPACIGGERACPPEDCGGPSGYDQIQRYVDGNEDIPVEYIPS